jgi:succinoglycan biosynthesis protein ExoM
MDILKDHITVCICTYRRPKLLSKLLDNLDNQVTDNLFTFSISIVDNDSDKSAKKIVDSYKEILKNNINYDVVVEKSFSLARNRTIENSYGNYLALIDDDEYPSSRWLLELYNVLRQYNVSGVLAPVLPYFESTPKKWILQSGLCNRVRLKTGTYLDLKNIRTGNVLLKRDIFEDKNNYFNPVFGKLGGEDIDFFKKMFKQGHEFVWCDEATVFELVPEDRLKKSFFLKRAFLRGHVSYLHFKNEINFIQKINLFVKTLIAIILYSILLPFLLIIGFGYFMKYLEKLTNHFSRFGTMLGFVKIKERRF